MKLSDLIIESGPAVAGGKMPFPAADNGYPIITAAQINELREELIAARKAGELRVAKIAATKALRDLHVAREQAPDLSRFRTYVISFARSGDPAIGITHDECPSRWTAEVDDFTALAELVQRAGEHAEVCGD